VPVVPSYRRVGLKGGETFAGKRKKGIDRFTAETGEYLDCARRPGGGEREARVFFFFVRPRERGDSGKEGHRGAVPRLSSPSLHSSCPAREGNVKKKEEGRGERRGELVPLCFAYLLSAGGWRGTRNEGGGGEKKKGNWTTACAERVTTVPGPSGQSEEGGDSREKEGEKKAKGLRSAVPVMAKAPSSSRGRLLAKKETLQKKERKKECLRSHPPLDPPKPCHIARSKRKGWGPSEEKGGGRGGKDVERREHSASSMYSPTSRATAVSAARTATERKRG